jgi:hypothetical protein
MRKSHPVTLLACSRCMQASGVKGQAPQGARNVLVWLRNDLRLHDNPALHEAARMANLLGGAVTLLFTHSPEEDGEPLDTGCSWRTTGAGGYGSPYGFPTTLPLL